LNKSSIDQYVKNAIEFSFARSRGPGGQNINKLNTRVIAKLSLDQMAILTKQEKNRVRSYLKNRINKQDEIVIQVQERRTQHQNREIATERMVALIVNALKEEKKRIITVPGHASKEKRIREKKIIGEKKKMRRKIGLN